MWYILISSSKKGEKKQRTRKPTEQEKGSTSVPVGYEQIVEMYPLDFEEFLWANNLNEEIINVLKRCLEDIWACFNAIPKQLAKENKKYQWSKVESGGRGVHYKDSLQWLEDADIIRRCYNSNITGLPLEGNAIDNIFKVYTVDIACLRITSIEPLSSTIIRL